MRKTVVRKLTMNPSLSENLVMSKLKCLEEELKEDDGNDVDVTFEKPKL